VGWHVVWWTVTVHSQNCLSYSESVKFCVFWTDIDIWICYLSILSCLLSRTIPHRYISFREIISVIVLIKMTSHISNFSILHTYIYFSCTNIRIFLPTSSKGAEPEFRSPRVKLLWDKWRHVWMLAWERQRRLQDKYNYIQELDRVANFSWEDWRKRVRFIIYICLSFTSVRNKHLISFFLSIINRFKYLFSNCTHSSWNSWITRNPGWQIYSGRWIRTMMDLYREKTSFKELWTPVFITSYLFFFK